MSNWTLKINDRQIEEYPASLTLDEVTSEWANPEIADRVDRGSINGYDRVTLTGPDGQRLRLLRGTCPFLGMGNYRWLEC